MDWKNHLLSLDQRLDDLLGRLTLEEKISLLDDAAPAVERLGLPKFKYGGEALHGLCNTGRATSFPMPIGMAATFDAGLIERVASATGDEMRAKYHAPEWQQSRLVSLLVYSPVINILRDPRWGRTQETYGEDPFLTGQLGAAYVRGLQGNHSRYLKLAACAKHLGVHSGPEKLRQHFNAMVSEEDLHETYLPAFEALVRAGVRTIMATYNRVNGEHCCAHSVLIGDFLRGQLGFDGVVLSDGGALSTLHRKKPSEHLRLHPQFGNDGDAPVQEEGHNLTEDLVETAALCLRQQCDLELGTHAYHRAAAAMERGLLSELEIDRAVRRILRLRFELGEYDPPENNPYSRIPVSVIQSDRHLAIAREVARKSLVLLKNEAETLPLCAGRDHTVLVTGPTSVDLQILLGNYYKGSSGKLISLLEGITGEAPEGVTVTHSQGCFLCHPNLYDSDWYLGLTDWASSVVACIGYSPLMEGEQGECIGAPDGGDKTTISLPENQLVFLRKLRARLDQHPSRPRLVCVVTGGTPLDLVEVSDLADAVLFAWYPGQEGGAAVGEILWGKANPSGKLPVTFPRHLEDLPPYENYDMAGRSYRFMDPANIHYPFGYGLSYTRFALHSATLNPDESHDDRGLSITLILANTGQRDGGTVVQAYAIHPGKGGMAKKLIAFQPVELKAGTETAIQLHLQKLPSQTQTILLTDGAHFEKELTWIHP